MARLHLLAIVQLAVVLWLAATSGYLCESSVEPQSATPEIIVPSPPKRRLISPRPICRRPGCPRPVCPPEGCSTGGQP
uniref:Epidermal patterning factor-like protein n=1 Tax=Oryza punctata TaxID=4537 RepID=A0A0E0JXA4_ORYPU